MAVEFTVQMVYLITNDGGVGSEVGLFASTVGLAV